MRIFHKISLWASSDDGQSALIGWTAEAVISIAIVAGFLLVVA